METIARGLRSATRPLDLDDSLQVTVLHAVTKSMTGVDVNFSLLEPIEPDAFAQALSGRSVAFRTRLVQVMELGHLSLPGADVAVADRVIEYANALGVDNECIHKARAVADGSHLLVAADFDRNSYIRSLDPSVVVDGCIDATAAWSTTRVDEALAARWRSLGELAPDSIGHRVHEFYLARGFAFPGEDGSAPPLLAQHDWVHVLADFGTTVECELEVFGFIARASEDPQAFALLAMALTLFQTGSLPSAAGIFEADSGHLGREGMPARLGDAMRRGACCEGSVDFLAVDWFSHAESSVSELRAHFGVQPKTDEAKRAGSVGPWDPGGISELQKAAARRTRAAGQP